MDYAIIESQKKSSLLYRLKQLLTVLKKEVVGLRPPIHPLKTT